MEKASLKVCPPPPMTASAPTFPESSRTTLLDLSLLDEEQPKKEGKGAATAAATQEQPKEKGNGAAKSSALRAPSTRITKTKPYRKVPVFHVSMVPPRRYKIMEKALLEDTVVDKACNVNGYFLPNGSCKIGESDDVRHCQEIGFDVVTRRSHLNRTHAKKIYKGNGGQQ